MATAPLTKMLPPGTTLWWVDESVAATKEQVLKATLYASDSGQAVDLTCAVESGYTLGATDSDTDDSSTLCDSGGVQTPTKDNYEGSITFFREAINQETGAPISEDSPGAKAFKLFKKGGAGANKRGWLVKRVGYPNSVAAKAGQEVSAFKVMPDNPQDVDGDQTTPIKITVNFLPQGMMILNEPLT